MPQSCQNALRIKYPFSLVNMILRCAKIFFCHSYPYNPKLWYALLSIIQAKQTRRTILFLHVFLYKSLFFCKFPPLSTKRLLFLLPFQTPFLAISLPISALYHGFITDESFHILEFFFVFSKMGNFPHFSRSPFLHSLRRQYPVLRKQGSNYHKFLGKWWLNCSTVPGSQSKIPSIRVKKNWKSRIIPKIKHG